MAGIITIIILLTNIKINMKDEQLAIQEAKAFEVWTRDTVMSIHYANNESMAEAYDRVFNNSLEMIVYENIKRQRSEPS
jgi:hypothetical protein